MIKPYMKDFYKPLPLRYRKSVHLEIFTRTSIVYDDIHSHSAFSAIALDDDTVCDASDWRHSSD